MSIGQWQHPRTLVMHRGKKKHGTAEQGVLNNTGRGSSGDITCHLTIRMSDKPICPLFSPYPLPFPCVSSPHMVHQSRHYLPLVLNSNHIGPKYFCRSIGLLCAMMKHLATRREAQRQHDHTASGISAEGRPQD